MKSTSSFTVLPDFGLYCSSKNFFMMRVGGQSGTAIVSVTSSAFTGARLAPATVITAAKAEADASPFSINLTVILGILPFSNRSAALQNGCGSAYRLTRCRLEDVDFGRIDDDRR